MATHAWAALRSVNPLFMKYEPNSLGEFAGQSGYGYRSIEEFVRASRCVSMARAECEGDGSATLTGAASLLRARRALCPFVGQRYDEDRGVFITVPGTARLAAIQCTAQSTAVLEAGRMSLDHGGLPVQILYGDGNMEESEGPESSCVHDGMVMVPTGLRIMEKAS